MVYRPLRYEQMMKASEPFDVRARRMFNGMGVDTGEKMFAVLFEKEVGLKLAPTDYEEALSLPGAELMRTEPDAPPMKEYVRMPQEILDNHDLFIAWVSRSAEYAQSTRIG